MKKAYFYINGVLLNSSNYKEDEVIIIKNKYICEINNFGVSKTFDKCKYGAICDVFTNYNGIREIIDNSYVIVFEIEIPNSDYKTIDDEIMLADFDILEIIKNNTDKIFYNGMFDTDKNFIENFI